MDSCSQGVLISGVRRPPLLCDLKGCPPRILPSCGHVVLHRQQHAWSPGGAALFAHTVILGGGVPIPHQAAHPPLLPAVHCPIAFRPRLTLDTGGKKQNELDAIHFFIKQTSSLGRQHKYCSLSPRSKTAIYDSSITQSEYFSSQMFLAPKEL